MLVMAANKHRDAPEGVQEDATHFFATTTREHPGALGRGNHPHRHVTAPARSHRKGRAVPTPPPIGKGVNSEQHKPAT